MVKKKRFEKVVEFDWENFLFSIILIILIPISLALFYSAHLHGAFLGTIISGIIAALASWIGLVTFVNTLKEREVYWEEIK